MSKAWRVVVLLVVGWGSHADRAAAEDKPLAEADSVSRYAFNDEQVLGDTLAPNGQLLHARTRGARESLVQARMHFVRELCHSLESL